MNTLFKNGVRKYFRKTFYYNRAKPQFPKLNNHLRLTLSGNYFIMKVRKEEIKIMEQEILKTLNQLAELAIDSGYAEVRSIATIGEVEFYFAPVKNKKYEWEKDIFSFTFRELDVVFKEDKIMELKCDTLTAYNMNLYLWTTELREALTEGIAQLTADKHEELEEARATGN